MVLCCMYQNHYKSLNFHWLEPSDYYAHYKIHIGKEMHISVTAFILTNENDISEGGVAVPIAMVRGGKMVSAAKDTYKCVYHPSGLYHYPKIAENKVCTKGQMYFKPVKLSGSSEGTEKKPKILLLKVYKEEIVPAIEEKVVKRFNNNGERKVLILK